MQFEITPNDGTDSFTVDAPNATVAKGEARERLGIGVTYGIVRADRMPWPPFAGATEPADECDGTPEPGDIDPDNPYDRWAETPGGWDGYTDEDQA